MNNETQGQGQGKLIPPVPYHSFIPLGDFKAFLGVDDREDKISRFCLVTATFTIEQYCRRRLFLKRHFERIGISADLVLPLREYPVREILAVYALSGMAAAGEAVGPEFYHVIPELEGETGEWPEDRVYSLCLMSAYCRGVPLTGVKVEYLAGYDCGEAGSPYGVPADLASACLELAAWNMSRYRGKRIGITGNVRGSGRDGEHLEASMPENVRLLLEPYRRRII